MQKQMDNYAHLIWDICSAAEVNKSDRFDYNFKNIPTILCLNYHLKEIIVEIMAILWKLWLHVFA